MNLECDVRLASHFTSPSQQVRVVTEGWFASAGYCLACPSDSLHATKPNTIAHDFICADCKQSYELKSSARFETKRIVDGAYATMVLKIQENRAPSLLLLNYLRNRSLPDEPWKVKHLVAIHPVFLTYSIVEPRSRLGEHARRAGWQGCNLRIDRIPADGRIELIIDGRFIPKDVVRARYASSNRFAQLELPARGWAALVLHTIRQLGRSRFVLADVYARSQKFEEAFPNNRHIHAKIRQQLQVLRDLGYLQFTSRGEYILIA